jgi:hypothetical protein
MKVKLETAAIVTIKNASDMTPEGRVAIAQWLREQANYLIEHGSEYSKKCIFRYQYSPYSLDMDVPPFGKI